jgi:two-component system response regulator MtrA
MSKVLLAEDDPTMISLLKTLLNIEGFEVETILDQPGNLLENMCKAKPDVVLLDVHLGELNGVDIIRQMRQVPELKSVKVIMSSGMHKEDECLAAGADDFLLKPYMPEELLRRLR